VRENDDPESLGGSDADDTAKGQCDHDGGQDEWDGDDGLREGTTSVPVPRRDVGERQSDDQGEDGAHECLHRRQPCHLPDHR
jgi:hypothetical protein